MDAYGFVRCGLHWWEGMMTGLIRIVEGCLLVLSFGQIHATWETDFHMYRIKKESQKKAKREEVRDG